jgi:dihydroflavonol-4-reductase
VITSSVAAISHVAPDNELEAYDETSWSDVVTADFSAYVKSKTLAERAAWDFQ